MLSIAAIVMRDRASDITGVATIGVGPWPPGAALGIIGGAAAAAAAPSYYGAPYGYAAPGYGYAAPAYGYGYAAPAYGYGARGCDPYYGC